MAELYALNGLAQKGLDLIDNFQAVFPENAMMFAARAICYEKKNNMTLTLRDILKARVLGATWLDEEIKRLSGLLKKSA